MINKDMSIIEEAKKTEIKKIVFLIVSFLVMIVAGLISTSLGVINSNIMVVFRTVIKGLALDMDLSTTEKIILNLRLPRTLLGMLSGIGLSVSGVVMQGITRNPLVSPFTIGVSSAAGFGASVAIVFGLSLFGGTELGIISNAFIMSIFCIFIIFIMSQKMYMSSQSVVLVGIALNYLFQAASTMIQFLADDNKLSKVVNWTFGSLNGATWNQVNIVFLFVIVCISILLYFNKELTILSTMEDELIKTIGIDPVKLRIIGSILSALMTASIISFTGIIGFIGLAAPHIARTIIGNNYKYLLPGSAIIGATLIIVADTIGRTILSPIIIPVGIIISFIGVPLFFHQVVINRRQY